MDGVLIHPRLTPDHNLREPTHIHQTTTRILPNPISLSRKSAALFGTPSTSARSPPHISKPHPHPPEIRCIRQKLIDIFRKAINIHRTITHTHQNSISIRQNSIYIHQKHSIPTTYNYPSP